MLAWHFCSLAYPCQSVSQSCGRMTLATATQNVVTWKMRHMVPHFVWWYCLLSDRRRYIPRWRTNSCSLRVQIGGGGGGAIRTNECMYCFRVSACEGSISLRGHRLTLVGCFVLVNLIHLQGAKKGHLRKIGAIRGPEDVVS